EMTSNTNEEPNSAQQSFDAQLEVNNPIDRSMRLSELNGQNVKPILAMRYCGPDTVLELLVAKAFIEEVPAPPDKKALKNESDRRRDQRSRGLRKRQIPLITKKM